jgi:hypothetical protein
MIMEEEKLAVIHEKKSDLRGSDLENFPPYRFGAAISSSELIHDDMNAKQDYTITSAKS